MPGASGTGAIEFSGQVSPVSMGGIEENGFAQAGRPPMLRHPVAL